MRSTITQLSPATASAGIGDMLTSKSAPEAGSWKDIVAQVSHYLSASSAKATSSPASLGQLTGLLRLQIDVTRYQLRVEVVSKIAESAVVSLRKLQQAQ
jgi:hypothetical protein